MKKLSLFLCLAFLLQCSSAKTSDSVKSLLLLKVLGGDSPGNLLTGIAFEKSNYTISQDLSSVSTVELSYDKKNISFEEKSKKYVSNAIKLSKVKLKDKFIIKTDLDIKFELYRGAKVLDSNSSNRERFIDLSQDYKFKLNKVKDEYEFEVLSSGDYLLFLVSDRNGSAKVQKKVSTSYYETPTQNIEVTDRVREFSIELPKSNPDLKDQFYRVNLPQFSIDALKGDKVVIQGVTGSGVGLGWYYTGKETFKDKYDVIRRQTGGFPNGPAIKRFSIPGFTFVKSGPFSALGYTVISSKYITSNNNTMKVVKVTPYVPPQNSAITPIGKSYKTIDYIKDNRNEMYSAFTSKQFTLSNVKKGTKLIIEHTSGSLTAHKIGDFTDPTFYTGTERLTNSNISNRFIAPREVVGYGSYNYSIVFDRAGDYSIVFTYYNKTKPTTHRVKFE